ncbi:hypothetical protein CVT25_007960 [Psilocybe cyanescens]|uniref:Nuclear fusion protein KAR5 n=1 Tax=Psilocybe cyanescens TaxID=93625 RepID=A0A409XMW3_PSICY|nr:hypothetical protein CVT25_007960 [Psilocybe cyanescens]
MVLLKKLLIYSPILCYALSWRANTAENKDATATIDTIDASAFTNDLDRIMGEENYDSLRLNIDALHSYTRKPDCFKKAASIIRARCTELDMDEDGRRALQAAISMTLCEIATAKHHSYPMECHQYSVNGANAPKISSQSQGGCVDALARSAQFWSSYSGYLREVPQLCHAFRRWNDIDLARNIYYNATIEKIALVRFIVDREKKTQKMTAEWMKRSIEIQDASVELRSASAGLISDMHDFFSHLNEQFSVTMANFGDFSRRSLSLREQLENNSIAMLELALADVTHRHSASLGTLIDSLEPILSSRLDAILTRHEGQYEKLDSLISTTQIRWIELGYDLNGMKQVLLDVSDQAAQTASALTHSLHDARGLRDIQHEAFLATNALVDTVVHLTDMAHAEFDTINGSAYLIKQYLQNHQQEKDVWKIWIAWMLGLVYRGNRSDVFDNMSLT